MDNFSIILISILSILLILNHLSLSKKATVSQIIKNMGIGYNLANTFDNYIEGTQIDNPIEQISLKGNQIPTKKMIKNLKRQGFNTIRLPVTWIYFIDNYGNIQPKWMSQIKNVVDIIVKNKVYCILNIYGDTDYPNWLSEGKASKDIYTNFWRQIAEEFKDYDEYLIFESMDDTIFFDYDNYDYDYESYGILNQLFIDTIRNSSKFNKERLLIISSINSEIEVTCSEKFRFPNDTSNKLALSIHYYKNYEFATGLSNYEEYIKWGYQENFNNLISDFDKLKNNFINKGIPVIISEFGVLTERKKEIDSIRLYIYSILSLSINYGIVACLRDTSNKEYGNMNFYNRENYNWYDKKLGEIILSISRGKTANPLDYLIITNNIFNLNEKRKQKLKIPTYRIMPIKIIVNALLKIRVPEVKENLMIFLNFNSNFGYATYLLNYDIINIKKQYDGTIIVETDVNIRTDFFVNYVFDNIEIVANTGTINNITIVLEKSLNIFNYISFKSDFFNQFN